MKPHIRTKLTKTVLWFALTMATVWAMALSMQGCGTLASIPPDKVIEAASKCIADATSILASQAELLETRKAAADLQATEEAAAKICPCKKPLEANPYVETKP